MPRELLPLIGRAAAWSCVAAITLLSLLPGEEMVRTDLGGHAEHVLAYAIAALIVAYAYNNVAPYRVFGALILYAACLEYLQRFSPGRHSRLIDFAFSALGVVVGAAIFVIGRKLLRVGNEQT
jgi:VanZ family protein